MLEQVVMAVSFLFFLQFCVIPASRIESTFQDVCIPIFTKIKLLPSSNPDFLFMKTAVCFVVLHDFMRKLVLLLLWFLISNTKNFFSIFKRHITSWFTGCWTKLKQDWEEVINRWRRSLKIFPSRWRKTFISIYIFDLILSFPRCDLLFAMASWV